MQLIKYFIIVTVLSFDNYIFFTKIFFPISLTNVLFLFVVLGELPTAAVKLSRMGRHLLQERNLRKQLLNTFKFLCDTLTHQLKFYATTTTTEQKRHQHQLIMRKKTLRGWWLSEDFVGRVRYGVFITPRFYCRLYKELVFAYVIPPIFLILLPFFHVVRKMCCI